MDDPTPAQRIMIDDGLPSDAIMAPEERREAWKNDKQYARDMLRAVSAGQKAATRKENAMKTEPKTKTSKADQVAGLRAKRAAEKGPKASGGKKAAKAKARTPAAPRPAPASGNGPRPGSKVALVAGLLTRKQGCTAAAIKEACEWTAVSVPAQAKAAGLTLRQEKIDGVTHYFGTAV
jgi:hypothetical protein